VYDYGYSGPATLFATLLAVHAQTSRRPEDRNVAAPLRRRPVCVVSTHDALPSLTACAASGRAIRRHPSEE